MRRWCSLMRFSRQQDAGNVFAIIFLGVALFAALIYAVSRGLNTGSATLSMAQARNYASDILTYAQQVERSVDRMLQSGVSENDLSFENTVVPGYGHTPAVSTTAQIFNQPAGLGVQRREPIGVATANGDDQWIYDGKWIITNLGDDARSELVMYLFVNRDVCAAINTQLGNNIDITSTIGAVALAKFTGTYTDGASVMDSAVTGNGCYRASASLGAVTSSYVYIHVLLAR